MADTSLPAFNTGIYEIVNTVNGKRYVGSAVSFRRRWYEHRRQLKAGSHHSRKLQAAWKKHGEAAFQFSILLICAKPNLLLYEQVAIDNLRPDYNISPTAGSTLGFKFTEESKQKIRAKALGRVWTDEAKSKLSATISNRKLSAEHAAKLIGNKNALGMRHTEAWKAANSARFKGQRRGELTETHKANLAEALRGRRATPEARAKQSEAQLGKKRGPYSPWSQQAKRNHEAAMANRLNPMLGKSHSPAARQKISAAHKGRKLSEEQCAARASATRARWADPDTREQLLESQRRSRQRRDK